MTILDEVGASIRQVAEGAGASVVGIGQRRGGGRGLRFGFTPAIERPFGGPRGRRIAGSLEHTAPLLPGSSGGPVLDAGGRLLGINTSRLGEGFYLAIPADETLRGRADALAPRDIPDSRPLGGP